MNFRLSDLAPLISGEVRGDSFCIISKVAEIETAQKGDLVFALDKKNISAAFASKASAVVCSEYPKGEEKSALITNNPRLALARILSKIHKKTLSHPAKISKLAKIGKNVEIGKNTKIMPNVTVYDNVKIGKNVIIHSGTVIGIDGFGFVPQKEGLFKIPQVGKVIIEDDVEIYSNCTIARGTIGDTIIGKGTKIDCGVHIAHNCKIGKNCAIAGHVALAGSVTLKDNVQVAGQVGFNSHITVGENTLILARSGITKDIPSNSIVSGFPAIEHKKDLENQVVLRQIIKSHKKKPA